MARWQCPDSCTDAWASPPPAPGALKISKDIEYSQDMESITEGEHHKELEGVCIGWGDVAPVGEGVVQPGTGYDSSPYVSIFKTEEMYVEKEIDDGHGGKKKVNINDGVKISSTLFHSTTDGKFFHSVMPTLYKWWCRNWGGDSVLSSDGMAQQGVWGLPWVLKQKHTPPLVPFFAVFNIRSNDKWPLKKGLTEDGKDKNLYFQFDIKQYMDLDDLAKPLNDENPNGPLVSYAEGGKTLQQRKLNGFMSAHYDLNFAYTGNVTPYTPNSGLVNDLHSATGQTSFVWPRKVMSENLDIELVIWIKPEIRPMVPVPGFEVKSQHLMSSLKARLIFEVRKTKLFYMADPGPGGTDPLALI